MTFLGSKIPTWVFIVLALVCLFAVHLSWVGQGVAEERAKVSAQALAMARDSAKGLGDSLDALAGRLGAARGRVDTLWRVRAAQLATADTSRRSADSVIALAPPDTIAVCRPIRIAYDLRTTECAQLRQVVASDSTAIRGARAQLDTATGLTEDLRRSNAALALKLATVAKPYTCKVVLFIPCPSRLTVFVAGAVGGFILGKRGIP